MTSPRSTQAGRCAAVEQGGDRRIVAEAKDRAIVPFERADHISAGEEECQQSGDDFEEAPPLEFEISFEPIIANQNSVSHVGRKKVTRVGKEQRVAEGNAAIANQVSPGGEE